VDVLGAGRVHVDLWAAGPQDRAHHLVDRIPTAGVARPVDLDYTATVGLARNQACALVAAADADQGPQVLRTDGSDPAAAAQRALRVNKACAADLGHQALRTCSGPAGRA
jgi:hypothetical protein